MTASSCAPTCSARWQTENIRSFSATVPMPRACRFRKAYKGNWARLVKAAPEVLAGSSNKYQNWELVDPEKWVPDGYAIVRVDSRGAGRSPGFLDVWSPREARDLYDCVEWAGTQSWSNGKVGINGISYYAMNQWNVGALKPPHLAALCIWEGSSDYYRELCRHGGILSDFFRSWHPRQVASVQHGVGSRGAKSVVTGELVAGPRHAAGGRTRQKSAPTRQAKPSAAACSTIITPRAPPHSRRSRRRFCRPPIGAAWGCTPAAISKVSCAPAAKQKWLEVHGDTHFTHFYSSYGETLQKRFFGHFLKGEQHRLGQAAARVAQRPPSARDVRAARRERMAARAHAMDQIFSAARWTGTDRRKPRVRPQPWTTTPAATD